MGYRYRKTKNEVHGFANIAAITKEKNACTVGGMIARIISIKTTFKQLRLGNPVGAQCAYIPFINFHLLSLLLLVSMSPKANNDINCRHYAKRT